MPVYLFALSQHSQPELWKLTLSFCIIHFLLYPASNGFNSYYDRDEGSIGGLKDPPPVKNDLLYTSLALDALAIALGFIISPQFSLMLFIYGLVSKAYSHPAIRLKKYAIPAWLTAGIFQGGFTYCMVLQGLNDLIFTDQHLIATLLSTLMILGFYPLTQIYQHDEDKKRGDITISYLAGIRGTFILSGLVFTVAFAGFGYFFYLYYGLEFFGLFMLFLSPALLYFLWWAGKCWRNPLAASYKPAMHMNLSGSMTLSLFFLYLFLR
ncbi:MAG: UbiA family prenyltransferase [Bacteroidota bacterium]|nr:UbiA family prenyltransferase [Bacteroidota bacterium]